MRITRLRVKNFKSIRDAEINFPPMTLVVGANAAGKSNFVSVFKFLSDLLSRGLEAAIALQGGIEWLVNANLPKGTPVEIAFTMNVDRIGYDDDDGFYTEENYYQLKYDLRIVPNKRGNGYKIGHDELILTVDQGVEELYKRNKSGYINYKYKFKNLKEKEWKLDLAESPVKKILEKPENQKEAIFHFLPFMISSSSQDEFIRVFDFDPRILKRPSPIESVPELTEDGSNLANVLRNILRSKKKQEELTALLNDFLPFVEKVGVDSNADRSFSYKIRENYSKKAFHENFLSDGTVSILAILTALYFQEKANIVILEEPERNLHPKLLSKLLSAAEDVSAKKQIILTTHNPEFLKHAKIEHVLFISRDDEGFTVFQSPKDSETVRAFMENDLGMDDLFLQDMLGA